MESGTLPVDGGSLYYEVQGNHGPPILLIAGGSGTTTMFSTLATTLATHFHVISYDRRGTPRSCRFHWPRQSDTLRTHAQDAATLLMRRFSGMPAIIFTTSGSTAIALELVNLFPDLVSKVVLHEPILYSFLSVGQRKIVETKTQEALQAYRKFGIAEANRAFLPLFQIKQDSNALKIISISEYPGSTMPTSWKSYYEHELPAIVDYVPNPDSLARTHLKIYVVEGSVEVLAFVKETILGLSKLLGRPPFRIAGGHIGYATHAAEFGGSLITLLCNQQKAKF
ncbi:Alpha/Beta hydrolase protein [Aspergillus novoparasiticus]|uniref:Alpha/Beta hydrolase protein n=1 Tax=Aspergillus novoparasiticus TaxID=986946 RepID=A0A5N6EZ62_9EURO|nr:Alpha/Beta hydrolase protein [Aspergillus novoparasiticus]